MYHIKGNPIHICRMAPKNGITLLSPSLGRQCPYCGEQMIAQEHIDHWFMYHTPTPEQIPKYGAIREAGKSLAQIIMDNSPASADQSAAIRKVREAVMTANAAIACDGK